MGFNEALVDYELNRRYKTRTFYCGTPHHIKRLIIDWSGVLRDWTPNSLAIAVDTYYSSLLPPYDSGGDWAWTINRLCRALNVKLSPQEISRLIEIYGS